MWTVHYVQRRNLDSKMLFKGDFVSNFGHHCLSNIPETYVPTQYLDGVWSIKHSHPVYMLLITLRGRLVRTYHLILASQIVSIFGGYIASLSNLLNSTSELICG